MNLLDTVPEWPDRDDWVRRGLDALGAVEAGAELRASWRAQEGANLGEPEWRRFVLAVFLADLACYPLAADQVSFERLVSVMRAFPRGFRAFWVKVPGAGWLPAGYTGWYPVSPATFAILEEDPSSVRDRKVMPDPEGGFVYVFNYSVIAPLRRTECSRQLLGMLAADLHDAQPRGLAALTVSAQGQRVAERLGMRPVGEGVYAVRAPPRRRPARR